MVVLLEIIPFSYYEKHNTTFWIPAVGANNESG